MLATAEGKLVMDGAGDMVLEGGECEVRMEDGCLFFL